MLAAWLVGFALASPAAGDLSPRPRVEVYHDRDRRRLWIEATAPVVSVSFPSSHWVRHWNPSKDRRRVEVRYRGRSEAKPVEIEIWTLSPFAEDFHDGTAHRRGAYLFDRAIIHVEQRP